MGVQADQIRHDILRRVLDRSLVPGDRIDESELKSRLAVSGTPVREALIALETAGVVERRPRDGARITSLDLEGVMKLVEVLAETEGAIAYLAARRINPRQAEDLKQATKACSDFVAGKAAPGANYYNLNLAFHMCLFASCGNEHMEQAVLSVGNRLVAYLAARHDLPDEPQRSAREHEAITTAILNGEADHARSLMIQHVSFSDRLAIDVMNAMKRDHS